MSKKAVVKVYDGNENTPIAVPVTSTMAELDAIIGTAINVNDFESNGYFFSDGEENLLAKN